MTDPPTRLLTRARRSAEVHPTAWHDVIETAARLPYADRLQLIFLLHQHGRDDVATVIARQGQVHAPARQHRPA